MPQERLKREYKAANKTREGYIDESDDEDPDPKKSKQEKAMRKLIREKEGNDAYDSDDDRNPYASSVSDVQFILALVTITLLSLWLNGTVWGDISLSFSAVCSPFDLTRLQEEEEEEEEQPPPPPPTDPTIPIQPKAEPQEISLSQTGRLPSSMSQPVNGSRATSPVAGQSMGGHSVVAKRATSPKPPKLRALTPTRAGSPLASPPNSPTANGGRAASPLYTATNGSQKKRKAADDPSNGVGQKAKKRKTITAQELTAQMVIDWVKSNPGSKTQDCIKYFLSFVKGDGVKDRFTQLVKEVASLKDGVLVLKAAYAG
jgi:transcription initiation factor TFIIF subunit alpha